jgi:hypothetical protein
LKFFFVIWLIGYLVNLLNHWQVVGCIATRADRPGLGQDVKEQFRQRSESCGGQAGVDLIWAGLLNGNEPFASGPDGSDRSLISLQIRGRQMEI